MSSARRAVFERLLVTYARHFPLRRGKMRLVDGLWPFLAGGDTHRTARLLYAPFKMDCDLREMLQRQYYFFGTYFLEKPLLDCWLILAKEASIIFDVGANLGIYSLAALSVQPRATVHAFEPTPEIATRLRRTAQVNGLERLHVHQAAVYHREGYATLHRFRGDHGANEGMNFIVDANDRPDSERVPTVSLDTFCRDHAIDRVDLLKVDVQGQEHAVLAGGAEMIRSGRIGTVFMELNWREVGEDSPAMRSIRLLEESGYRFAKHAKRPEWRAPGDWLFELNDVLARAPAEVQGVSIR